MTMVFEPTLLPDVLLIKPRVYGDDRGFFMETWEERKFADAGVPHTFVQDNHSRSVRHTLRGLHYQLTSPQGKLVRVVRGEVFDVAVDMRRSSPHFGKSVGVVLSESNREMLWVPPGFAHGFLVLSDVADFVYKCTDFYAPAHERTLRWDDPVLAIDWPLPAGAKPLLSAKDAAGASFSAADHYQ